MAGKPDLTIVIPALHEEKRLGNTLDKLAAFLRSKNTFKIKAVEVLVVAADTADRTWQIAENKSSKFADFKLLKSGAPAGKGRDVQFGMQRARGRYVLFMDADLATPLHHIAEFYRACQAGADIVIGTREIGLPSVPPHRRIANFVSTAATRAVTRLRLTDSQSGFRAFRPEVVAAIEAQGDRYEYETDFIVRASHRGYRIAEVSVPTIYGPPSHFRELVDSWRVARVLWSHRASAFRS